MAPSLEKVGVTPESTARRMEPHTPHGSEVYDRVETYAAGDGRFHHVFYKPPMGSGYQSVLHTISRSDNPLHGIDASSASGIHPAHLVGDWPSDSFTNNPWKDQLPVVVHGETTSHGPKGTGTILYQNMAKIHGRMASDMTTSAGANGVWEKLAKDPQFKSGLGYDKGQRHWVEYNGPRPVPLKVIQGDGRPLEDILETPVNPYKTDVRMFSLKSPNDYLESHATHDTEGHVGHLALHVDHAKKKLYSMTPYHLGLGAPGGRWWSFGHNNAGGVAAKAAEAATGYPYAGDMPWAEAEAKFGDKLNKMALADIPQGPEVPGYSNSWDYSHVLPEGSQNYRLMVYREPSKYPGGHDKLISRLKYFDPKDTRQLVGSMGVTKPSLIVGEVTGYLKGNDIEPHSTLHENHRGKGLGLSMYEALLAHAKHSGVTGVAGGIHSEDASRVHKKLAQRHGMKYKSKGTDQGLEENDKAPYSYALKAEDLGKMALADIPQGKENNGVWDYSHVLPEHIKNDYKLEVGPFNRSGGFSAKLFDKNGEHIGIVNGLVEGKKDAIEPHSILFDKQHRGKGLGLAMYEALFAHAKHNGITTVKGGPHSPSASRVHQRLAVKHGLDYKSKGTDQGLEENDKAPYSYALKAEDLGKMALADIPQGEELPGHKNTWDYNANTQGHQAFDYSHVLPEHEKHNFKLYVSKEGEQDLHALLYDKEGGIVGRVNGMVENGSIEPHSTIFDKHNRGRGLGLSMYEALFAHAKHNGITTVKGGPHSPSASRVHQRLAVKHGLDYKPQESAKWPPGNYAGDLGPYKYTLKSDVVPDATGSDQADSAILEDVNPLLAVITAASMAIPSAQLATWSPRGLSNELLPIAQLESNFGQNMHHTPDPQGEWQTAVGALGIKPETGYEEYLRSPSLQKLFPGLTGKVTFLEKLKHDATFYNIICGAHWLHLKRVLKFPDRAAYGWRHGLQAAKDRVDHEHDPYVIKYKALLHGIEQGLQKAEADEFAKVALDPNAGYKISHEHHDLGDGEMLTRVMTHHQGQIVGDTLLAHKGNQLEAQGIQVHPDHRRKGIASAMYNHAQQITGKTMMPSNDQTPMGQALWAGNKAKPQFGMAKSEVDDATRLLTSEEAPDRLLGLKMCNTPAHIESYLSAAEERMGEEQEVLEQFLKRPDVDASHLHRVLSFCPSEITEQVLKHPHSDASHIDTVLNDGPDRNDLAACVQHPQVTSEQILQAINVSRDFGFPLTEALGHFNKPDIQADEINHYLMMMNNDELPVDNFSLGLQPILAHHPNLSLNDFEAILSGQHSIRAHVLTRPMSKIELLRFASDPKLHNNSIDDILTVIRSQPNPLPVRQVFGNHFDARVRQAVGTEAAPESEFQKNLNTWLEPLEKMGAMQRLAPFNPAKEKPEKESDIRDWQDNGTGRSLVGGMQQNPRQRALHKLVAKTKVRKNPTTGENEYLLHRGVDMKEYLDAGNRIPGRVDHSAPTSWTPHHVIARNFAHDYKGVGGIHSILSAWVPESHIQMVPNQYGVVRSQRGIEDGAKGLGQNSWRSEHEVIVSPHHNSEAANSAEVLTANNPIASLHGRINQAGEEAGPSGRATGDWTWRTYRTKARLAAGRLIDPDPEIRLVRKHEESVEDSHGVAAAMLGPAVFRDKAFRAAFWLAGKTLDQAKIRDALYQEDGDSNRAALVAAGLDVTEENLQALQALMEVGSFQKSEAGVKEITDNKQDVEAPKSVQAGTTTAVNAAAAVQRGFKAGAFKLVNLGGKHSTNSCIVTDPETKKRYLLKPASGGVGPAAGVREETASQARREAAFSHIADSVFGLRNFVPNSELILLDNSEWCAVDMLPFDHKNLDKVKSKDPQRVTRTINEYRAQGILHRWAVLDFVLGQTDRHAGNEMISPSDHVYLIDQGSAFAAKGFDPGNDPKSFIPFYLRYTVSTQNFNNMDPVDQIKHMPVLNEGTDRALGQWIYSLDAGKLERELKYFGISELGIKACMDRLAECQQLDPNKAFAPQINELWLKT